MLFRKRNSQIVISEVILKSHYRFMYEGFVVSTQQALFLLLKQEHNKINALKFNFRVYKFGYPNDEVSHPLSSFGLGNYGLYTVANSPWLKEIINTNRSHQRHKDEMYKDVVHYIAKFKDNTLEVLCDSMEEIELTTSELISLVSTEIDNLVDG